MASEVDPITGTSVLPHLENTFAHRLTVTAAIRGLVSKQLERTA